MIDPLFWLGLSFVLVSMSLMAVLLVLLLTVRELKRAAKSVEKLCDTLNRELPPTLKAIQLTSLEITELTDDVTTGLNQASQVIQRVDQGVGRVRQQTRQAQVVTRSLLAGVRAAWTQLSQSPPPSRRRLPSGPSAPIRSSRKLSAGSTPDSPPRSSRQQAHSDPPSRSESRGQPTKKEPKQLQDRPPVPDPASPTLAADHAPRDRPQ